MKLSLTSAICALFLTSGIAYSQTDTTTEGTNNADTTFPVEGSSGTVEVGQPFTKEVHGAWEIRCIKGEESDTCNLYQLAKDDKENAVAEINIEVLPEGGQAAGGVTMVTPLGTLLTAKLRLQFDGGKARAYDYNWCEAAGCVARFGLTAGDIDAMKKGNNINITLVSIVNSKEPVPLALSLEGFTAAWNSQAAN